MPVNIFRRVKAHYQELTPCEIPPTADIKCWQAHRDRGQKCRRARRDRGQFGGEPAMTAVKKWWRARRPVRDRRLMSSIFKLRWQVPFFKVPVQHKSLASPLVRRARQPFMLASPPEVGRWDRRHRVTAHAAVCSPPI